MVTNLEFLHCTWKRDCQSRMASGGQVPFGNNLRTDRRGEKGSGEVNVSWKADSGKLGALVRS